MQRLPLKGLQQESGSGPRLSGLKVYSRGKAGAPVALVKRAEAAGTAARTAGTHPGTPQVGAGGSGEATASGGARRAPGNSGVFLPAVPASTGAVSVSSVRAMEGLERERALHEEMRALEARASNEADEDAREALSISLIEKIQEFHQLQKANRNAQAALRRIELFHAQKAGGAVQ